ncbi:MAG: hypothetical protein AB8G18_15590 [Gammaproteobacteria bacterium]
MGVFEYIGVLISVIMGLGITHLATGATKLIQHRDQVKFYLPHALWTVNILVFILLIWWGMFWWSGHTNWFVYEYLFITLYAIVLFFLASMLYPINMDKDIDVEQYFFRNRRWFFAALLIAWCLDVPETIIKASADLRALPQEYFWFVGLQMAMAMTGLLTRNRVIHLVLPIAWLGITVFYVTMSTVGQINT